MPTTIREILDEFDLELTCQVKWGEKTSSRKFTTKKRVQ